MKKKDIIIYLRSRQVELERFFSEVENGDIADSPHFRPVFWGYVSEYWHNQDLLAGRYRA